MDVFELTAKLGLDTSEYDKGLGNAANTGQTFGSKVGGVMKGAGKVIAAGIAAGATAVTAFAKKSIDAGMAFDSSMSNVAAISGAQGQAFDDLRDKALEMGAKTSFSATEAADAFSYMAMAGWKTGDMLDGIEGIMNLAAASGEDLAATSDIVTDALTAFGLSAGDSGHFADVLAAASSNANTNVGLMGETFKYVAPVAGALGYSAEDTAVAIGLMANAGIKGSQAGTALRSMMTRLVKPTKESQTAMNALGISVTNSDGTMKSFDEVIGDLRTSFDGLTKDEKAQYAAMLAGQEGMSGLLAIVNASEKDFNDLTKAINECDGAAEEMAKTRMNNLEGDIKLFNSAMESANITLSDVLKPTMREFVQFGTQGIASITTAFNENGLNGAMRAFGDVLSDGIALIISYIPKVVDAGTKVFTALVNGIIQNIPLLIQAVGQIGDTFIETLQRELLINMPQVGMVFYDLLETAQTAFNGIIKIIQDVFAGDWSAAWNDMLTLVGDVFNGLGDWFLERFNAAKNAITSIDWATVGSTVWSFIQNGISGIATWFTDKFTEGKNAIEAIEWADVGQAIWDFIAGAFSDIYNAFITLFQPAADGVKDGIDWAGLGTSILEFITSAFDAIGEVFTTIFENAKAAIEAVEWATVAQGIIDTISGALNENAPILGQAFDAIVSALQTALQGLADVWNNNIMPVLHNLWNWLTSMLGPAFDLIASAIGGDNEAMAQLNETINAALPIIAGIAGAILGYNAVTGTMTLVSLAAKAAQEGMTLAQTLLNAALNANPIGIVVGLIAGLVAAFITAWNTSETFRDTVTSAWEAVKSTAERVFSAIQTAVGNAWDAISSTTTEVWNTVSTAISNAINTARSTVTSVVTTIKTSVQSTFTIVKTFVSNTWDNIKKSISDAINNALDTVSSTVESIHSTIEEWFGNALSTAETVWGNIKSAIVDPIGEAWETVTSTVSGIFSDVETGFNNALSTVQSVWDAIKSAIETPINAALDTITGVIDSIKDALDFEWKWPHIPMPHFSVSGSPNPFDWFTQGVPKLSVDWYAKAMPEGMILNGATIFGMMDGNLLGGGDVGAEAVVGVTSLRDMIQDAVNQTVGAMLSPLVGIVQDIRDNMPTGQLVLDSGALVGGIAEEMDAELNRIASWKEGGRA